MKIEKEHRFEFSDAIKWRIKIDLPNVKSFDEELYKFENLEKTKILLEGYWNGRHFYIGKNRFCEPVIYVEMFPSDAYYGVEDGNDYCGKAYWLPKDQQEGTWYTGWDHGHAGDYSPYNAVRYGDTDGYKWPLVEMLMEVAERITEIENTNYIEGTIEETD